MTSLTAADEQSFAEHEAIATAIQPYIDAAKSGDGKSMRKAFFDHANIFGSLDGNLGVVDADSLAEIVNGLGQSPEVRHRIASIDVSGPAAAVRLEFINWVGVRFTDFLILYKQDGQWKISGKVYDAHSRN